VTNDKASEEKALDALGVLAIHHAETKRRTEQELGAFLSDEARKADLTPDELAGRGKFSFGKMWARIRRKQKGNAK
jgi:hypothetical protein